MNRLVLSLLVAGMLFVAIWALVEALPVADQTAATEFNSYGHDRGDSWNGMRLFGPP